VADQTTPSTPPRTADGEGTGRDVGSGAVSTKAAEPVDDLVASKHRLRVGRTTLDYTATTGRVVLREEVFEDGRFTGFKAKAEVSMTTYVVDGADQGRPVMFAFNGGPGSSSVWLHLGLLGPRRVLMGDAGALLPPPYALADNAESLLAVSDLVFIDPVSTGYSRVVEGSKAEPYHGYQGDIESVAELIRIWTSRNKRWLSPKFVAGESYGTLRGAALVEHLQTRHGMYINGLVLISSVLDISSIDFENQRNDRAHALYLPTYAAIAHYHGRLPRRRSLRAALAEAEDYAARDYPWVLSRGDRLTARERAVAVRRLAALTGLSEDYVDRADLRIEHWRFFGELLREQRLTTGRLDGRFTGPMASAIAENMDADPSMDAITGPYAAAFNHYVRAELGYHNDLPYEQITARVRPWSFKDFEGRPVDVTPKLERAMRANPHLKVHVAYGYYDGATPHFAAEDVFAHLQIPAVLRANIEHHYYEAGHMMYVHEPSRRKQSKDLAAFVTRAS
jgi:carboxypeptidase C (cathepsin A)